MTMKNWLAILACLTAASLSPACGSGDGGGGGGSSPLGAAGVGSTSERVIGHGDGAIRFANWGESCTYTVLVCDAFIDDFRPELGCANGNVAVDEPLAANSTLTVRVPLPGIYQIHTIPNVDFLPDGTMCTVHQFGVLSLGTTLFGGTVGPQAQVGCLGELPLADECIASIDCPTQQEIIDAIQHGKRFFECLDYVPEP